MKNEKVVVFKVEKDGLEGVWYRRWKEERRWSKKNMTLRMKEVDENIQNIMKVNIEGMILSLKKEGYRV